MTEFRFQIDKPYIQSLLNQTSEISKVYYDNLERIAIHLRALGIDDITAGQFILLNGIGAEEMCVGDLMDRGIYVGKNSSYSIKKLQDRGYLETRGCEVDKRKTYIKATKKGRYICLKMKGITEKKG